MVSSRSETKRRQKDRETALLESPKRTKVHAQRKFAQGANLMSSTLTPVKDKDKSKVNGVVVPTELLPAKRPNTEDFVTFLCFRGSSILPPKLNYFNVPTSTAQRKDDSHTENTPGSSRVLSHSLEKQVSELVKLSLQGSSKPTSAVQAFKKKYQEQQIAKQKISLTTLARKVKGKNMVRTRSAAILEENRRGLKTVTKPLITSVLSVKAKVMPKALVKRSIKRLAPLRGGLRSAGELPPGSDVGLKTERKTRPKVNKSSKRMQVKASKAIASSLSDFSSDDDQPLAKKQKINLKHATLPLNTCMSIRSSMLERLRRNRTAITKQRVTSRPSRKTKEAAALFMEEMLEKDLKNPEEDSDYSNESLSEKKAFDSLEAKKTGQKGNRIRSTHEKNVREKVSFKDKIKRNISNSDIIPTKKKKALEDKKLLKKSIVKLNMIKIKDTSDCKNLSDNKVTVKKSTSNTVIGSSNTSKTDTKGKKSEAILVPRSTRQRPGLVKTKTEVNEIDDKFNESDEEPLKNISSKKPNSPYLSSSKKDVIEKGKISKFKSSKNVLIGKTEEKEIRNESTQNKSSKKDTSVAEGISKVARSKPNLGNDLKTSCRKKVAQELYNKVKINVTKIDAKSGSEVKKIASSKKVESVSKTTGSTKKNVVQSVCPQKPKMKKGWVLCDSEEDVSDKCESRTYQPRSSKIFCRKTDIDNASKKDITNIKAEEVCCKKINKSCGAINKDSIPESISTDLHKKISNKTKETNKKSQKINKQENNMLTKENINTKHEKESIEIAKECTKILNEKKIKFVQSENLSFSTTSNNDAIKKCKTDTQQVNCCSSEKINTNNDSEIINEFDSSEIKSTNEFVELKVTSGPDNNEFQILTNFENIKTAICQSSFPLLVKSSNCLSVNDMDSTVKQIINDVKVKNHDLEILKCSKNVIDKEMVKSNMLNNVDKTDIKENSLVKNTEKCNYKYENIAVEKMTSENSSKISPIGKKVGLDMTDEKKPIISCIIPSKKLDDTNTKSNITRLNSVTLHDTNLKENDKQTVEKINLTESIKSEANNIKTGTSIDLDITQQGATTSMKQTTSVEVNTGETHNIPNKMFRLTPFTYKHPLPINKTTDSTQMQTHKFPIGLVEQQAIVPEPLQFYQTHISVQKVKNSLSFKPETSTNEKNVSKEGMKHNLESRTSEIESKDKLQICKKNIEKLKNDILGNMKEHKLKSDLPLPGFQHLKSSTKAKSMLKPGTLIDIAGGINIGLQSDSTTTFMRPPLDNAMTKAIKTDFFPPESVVPKPEPIAFSPNKLIKDEFSAKSCSSNTTKKEKNDNLTNKNKINVNDTWVKAFKNVKIPKPSSSSVVSNSDKTVRKLLFGKKNTVLKSDTPSPEKLNVEPPIPFLRQSKLFLGGNNQNQTKIDDPKLKLNSEIDMDNINKKRAEVDEIVIKYIASNELARTNSITISNQNDKEVSVNNPQNIESKKSLDIVISKGNTSFISASQSQEVKGEINNPEQNFKRSNSPFAIQQKIEARDVAKASSNNQITEDHTLSPTEEALPAHVPIPSFLTFSKSVRTVQSPVEVKHQHLPLPVEQTLKKLSLSKLSTNKKLCLVECNPPNSQEIKPEEIAPKLAGSKFNHPTTHDLLAKKKVNMSTEAINKWLSDSTSVGIEHKQNCGIFDRDHCECGYKTISPYYDNQEQVHPTINENCITQSTSNETVYTITNMESNKISTENTSLPSFCSLNDKNDGEVCKNKSTNLESTNIKLSIIKQNGSEQCIANENVTNKSAGTNIESNCDLENPKLISKPKTESTTALKVLDISNKNKPVETNITIPSCSTLTKTKLGKDSLHKKGDCEIDLQSRDPSEVSSPPPRDDISSSNDDSPDKFLHPERRAIFQQRRSMIKVKERKEAMFSILPTSSAFSPDNESSVYAFDPDPPPTSSTPPFRRCKKDGRTSSTATDDDESTPSSASIAVQVNLDNETVLECSTQTETQESDEDNESDGHLFYIPLHQNRADVTTTQQLIQGVAVKLGTEGPDQRVIMRAKLVTKPPSSFNRPSSSNSTRTIMPSQISRNGKPEQKVRPLSVKPPPVGTVAPTARPSTTPKPDNDKRNESESANNEVKPSKANSPDPNTSNQFMGKTVKRGKNRQSQITTATASSKFPNIEDPAKLVEAPTFYPNDKEFKDPLEYIDSIRPLAEKFGLCRVVPPSDFKPECKVSDDMRFTAYNQYVHKMLQRWGPNVKEMMAIRKYLATQSIALTHPPWLGGMEVDLPRLYQTVQACGGLKEVIEKKRWYKVADIMKIPKSAQDRVTKLDDIYCKFLLPYDTLSHEERTKLFEEVENDWNEREKRANDAADNDSEDSANDLDECIVKGRSMALNAFYRIARNTMSMWFSKTEHPSASEVETEFWRHVTTRQCHVCVHSGSIDSGSVGYGFPVAKNSSTSRHPWNLKVLTNNPGSILRSLGPIMGVTVPTLHVGMLFSACCWYRDPHGLPWIEYLHTGAKKIWYGIPDSSSNMFREAATKLVPRLCREKTVWLASDTAMVPPSLLVERGVSLCRVVQEPGQFIIVFPKAFTSSICTGYVVSESVYFAQPSWLLSAQQLFDDIRDSCEPSVFSLEKLLFSVITDSRSSLEVLNQILPMVLNIRDEEIARRKQLEELGLVKSEKLPSKRKKSRKNDEDVDYECEVCQANLFLSVVTNTDEDSVYCLSHAIKLLSKKRSQLKHCNFLYTYSEDELNDIVDKLKSRIENKVQKKLQMKNIQANKH